MNKLPKSPFSSRILDICSFALTSAILLLVPLLEGPQLKWLTVLLNERGFAPMLVLYFVSRNVMAVIIAKTRKELPNCYFKQLLIFSIFPLLFGFIGWVQGSSAVVAGAGDFLTSSGELEEVTTAIGQMFTGSGIAIDSLFLGLCGTVICLGLYAQSLSSKKKIIQQTSPGLLPQGVGSADP